MLSSIQRGSSTFKFRKRAFLFAKTFFDLSFETSCSGFEISGTEPPDCNRRIIFLIDDKFYRFVNNILDEFPYAATFDNVLKYGNTVGELLNLRDVSAFVNRRVYPVIALDAPFDSPVFPKIKLGLKVNSYNDIYTKFEYSPVFNLRDNSKIVSIIERKNETGNATSITSARVKKITGWSDWLHISEIKNIIASQIQFRTNYVVSTLDGTDSVTFDGITLKYTDDALKNAANFQVFVTKTVEFDYNLHTCYLLVNHSPLEDANIQAFVNLSKKIQRRENVALGTTAGIFQTLYLPEKFLIQDTLHLTLDDTPFFDFNFDTERSALEFTAPAGKNVFASYDYAPAENWLPMSKDFSDLQKTRFTFRTLDDNFKSAAVLFVVTGLDLPKILSYAAGLAV